MLVCGGEGGWLEADWALWPDSRDGPARVRLAQLMVFKLVMETQIRVECFGVAKTANGQTPYESCESEPNQ